MCPSRPSVKTPGQLAAPEKIADPTDIGSVRRQEDEDLFGGIPDLRVDRSLISGGLDQGTGLGEM